MFKVYRCIIKSDGTVLNESSVNNVSNIIVVKKGLYQVDYSKLNLQSNAWCQVTSCDDRGDCKFSGIPTNKTCMVQIYKNCNNDEEFYVIGASNGLTPHDVTFTLSIDGR